MRGSKSWLHAGLIPVLALATITSVPLPCFGQTTSTGQSAGFSSGMLSLPFKLHLSDRSLGPGGTAGAYVGYTFTLKGLTVTPIVSTGVSAILTTSTTGSDKTISALGFTEAIGFIGQFSTGSKLHYGVLIGVDYVSHALNYEYEGKPYLSMELGYNFTQ